MRRTMTGLLLLACAGTAAAQDWPGWRGPNRDGTSAEKGFPVRWSATENVAWKTEIPGDGYSSPVVAGDRVFLTSAVGEDRTLLCLDRGTGKILWKKVLVTAPRPRIHKENSYASSTPETDGERVYVAFWDKPHFRVFCTDLEGNVLWKKTPGEFHSKHGFCSTPVLWKDTVIFNGDQDAVAWIVALDRKTGEERWRTDRPNRTRSYTPPVVFEAAGRPQLVLSGSKCVASYDPDTGRQIWIVDGPTEQYVASLVYADGLFLCTGGFPEKFVSGFRPDGKGNVTETHELWRERTGAGYVPSPVVWGSNVFLVGDDGLATCRDVKTGKQRWAERLGRVKHHASPVAAEGRIYYTNDRGVTWVVKAGPQFEIVSENEMGENVYSSMALSRGQILLRTVKHLYCIGAGAE